MNTVTADVRPAKITRTSPNTDGPTSRRALLGALVAAPAVLAAMPAMAADHSTSDDHWTALVASYHRNRAAWMETINHEDDAADDLDAACAALPPKPQEPASVTPNIGELTINQIKALGDAPENAAAWQAYERDLRLWTAARAAARDCVLAPGKARYDAAYRAYADAFNTLTKHRVGHAAQLAEKIEIIALDYEGDDIPQEYLAEVLADVRRLGGEVQ